MTRPAPGGARRRLLLAALALACVVPGEAQERSLTAIEAPPLTIRHPPGLGRIGESLAERGPAELGRIATTLGLPAPEHLDVYVLPRHARVDPSAWGLPLGPRWAAGYALTSRPVVVLRTVETAGPYGNEAHTVFVHELVHATCADALGPRYATLPAWLREGMASYLAFEWRVTDAATSARFALSGRPVPLAELERSFPPDGRRAEFAYLQAFAFVSWLLDEHGEGALRDLLARVRGGEEFRVAFRAAYGARPEELEARWRRRFLWRYRWLPLVTSSSTLWLVVTGLVLVAFVRRRRRAARIVALWEDEEATVAAGSEGP